MIVKTQVNDGYAEIILNHPQTRNAITGPMGIALANAIRTCGSNENVKCILLRGAGGSFCSGLNLKEFNAEPPPDWLADFGNIWRTTHRTLYECPKPIIVALEKFAINGGAALALAADLLIVGSDSYLQVGEVRQGTAAPYNMAWLRLRFSEHIAAQLTISGRRFSGTELLSLGIAFNAPSTDATVSVAHATCAELAAFPADALTRIKATLTGYRPNNADEWFNIATQNTPRRTNKLSKVQGG